MLRLSWDSGEVMFPLVASASASYRDAYGAPSPDVTVYPGVPMPTGEVLIRYLMFGPVTNTVRVMLPEDVSKAVRESRSNFMFVVNTDATITATVSAERQSK